MNSLIGGLIFSLVLCPLAGWYLGRTVGSIILGLRTRRSECVQLTPWQQRVALDQHAARRQVEIDAERLRLDAELRRQVAELEVEMERERFRRRVCGES